MTRYAYIKNGDAVSQLSSIASNLDGYTTSGPNAFIKDFLASINGSPIVVVSMHNIGSRFKFNNMQGRVFNSGTSFFEKLFIRPISLIRVFFTLLAYRPDRILCGSTGAVLWVGFLVSRILKVPIVHSRHNRVYYSNDSWYRKIRSSIDVWCIVKMKAVVCHGPYLKDELLKVGIKQDRLFEFDVNFEDLLAECDAISEHNTNDSSDKNILFIGRMEQNKGIFDLFEAFKDLLQKNKKFRLLYVGGGADCVDLQKRINDENLQAYIKLLGRIEHSRLASFITDSELIVTPTKPSFPEGRCMVVMEGLVLGVPVIAPDFGPFPYLVQHKENGLLFRAGSVSSLKEMLELFMENESLRLRLKQGSIMSGKNLIKPELSFSQAVKMAFA